MLSSMHLSPWTGNKFNLYSKHIFSLSRGFQFYTLATSVPMLPILLTLGIHLFLPYNWVELCLISTFEIKHKSLPRGVLSMIGSWEGGVEHMYLL